MIGFLGEFDALPGLSQVEAALEKSRRRSRLPAMAVATTCWVWGRWLRPLR